MPVDKVSIEKFAQTIKDKYPQYKDIDDTLLTNSIIEKHPEYKDMVDFNAKPAFKGTVDFSNPSSYLAPHAHEEYGAAVQGAAERLQAEAKNVDPAIKSLILDGIHQKRAAVLQSQLQQKGEGGNMAALNPRLHQELQRILPRPLPEEVPQDEVNNMKQAAQSDPTYFGMILQRHGEMNPDKMAQLKSDMYLLNSTSRAAGKESKILSNAQQMRDGKLDYDMAHPGSVQKPEGFFPSIVTAHQQRNKEIDDYEYFQNHSDTDIIKKLNDERNAYDPDEPQAAPKGFGGAFGSGLGGNAEMLVKGGLAGTLTTMAGAPEVAPYAGAAMITPEMTARAFAGSLKNNYYQLLDQGVNSVEALKKAKDMATVDAVKSGVQGAMMTVAGARLGMRPSAGYQFTPQFKSIVTGLAKETGKFTKEALSTAVPNAAIAGSLELGSNYIAQKQGIHRNIEQNVFEAAGGQLAMELGLGATLKLGGKALKVVLNNVAKQPQGAVQTSLKDMENHGTITPVEAQTISDKIDATKALNDQIPSHIEDENTRIKIQDLIEHKTKLEGDLEHLNKAYHPAIKNKISDIDEQIQKLSDLPVKEKAEGAAPSPKPTPGEKKLVGMPEDISPRIELSTKTENDGNQTEAEKANAQTKVLGQQTGTAPQEPASVLSHAKDLIQKGVDNGNIPEEYKPFIQHADHFLDFINRQVETGNENHLREEFGDELVDLAKSNPNISYAGISKITPKETILESRHANTPNDEKGITSGPNQDPLSKSGKRDANDLANDVAGKGVKKVISSDLERAKQTAKIVSDKTGATVEHNSNLRTWDIGDFDGATDKEFKRVQEYFVNHPDATEFEGKKIGESFNEYKDRVIKARTELEKEPSSTLLINHSNNMMLWDAYLKNGREWNEQAAHDYLNGEKPEPATLTTKNNNDAIRQQPAAQMGAHGNGPESIGGESEGSRMGRGQQRAEPTGKGGTEEGQSARQEEGVDKFGLPFTGRTSETVGISHGSATKRATESPVLPPERGEGVTVEEAVQHGRELLAKGEDAQKAAADFQKDKKISYDALSLVRAKHAELAKATNEAVDKFGENSPQTKAAGKAESDWYREVVKPMQTEWSKIGQTQQGETDIETGTVTGLRRAYQQETGKDFTPEQATKAKELSDKVKDLSKKVSDLEKQLTEAHEKEANNPEVKSIKAKAKQTADWIRKGKSAPPGSFSAATPASLVWDGMVEVAAKIVEAGGTIAEAIDAGIKHLKESDWYKGLSKDKQQQAEHDFEEHINEKNPDIRQRFANKKGNKFEPQDAKDIWDYAKKNYLDKGSSYTNMINNVSKDLGLSSEQVRNAITQPKGTRVISDEIYRQNAKRNDAINEAKRWVKTNNQPALIKFFKALPNFFFAAKVFGHGTVGMITHAGTNIFRPSGWGTYWKNFARQFKYAFGGITKEGLATYNKAMEDLKNDPQFTFWKRAGLAVDPKEAYDEYQKAGRIFGKINAIGERGFNALKTYRLDMAKMFYNRLSDVEKADPQTAKEIAKIVNHSTGTSEIKVPGWTNTVFFAPKLEAARWQGLITDPAKAVRTFTKWNKATPAEQVQAKIVARKAGEIMAVWATGLAANAALLSLTGSKQRINFTHPTASDWLKFKAGDKTLDVSGGMEATMRFIGTLLHSGYLAYTGNKKELKDKPQDKDYKTIGTQARYKLSPFMSTVMDFATGTDAMGRPVPGSKVKPPPGVEPYTVKSYVLEQQLPIPIAEGIKGTIESMKERGMDNTQIKDVLTGILIGTISGGTGAKVGNDYSLSQQTDEQKKTAAKLEKWKTELNITDKTLLPTDIQYDHYTPKPDEDQTEELNQMIKDSRQRLFESVQKYLDFEKMTDPEKKTALETVMKEGEETGKEAFKAKYPQFTPKRPEMTDEKRQKQQEQSEKERDIQRTIANKARELTKEK